MNAEGYTHTHESILAWIHPEELDCETEKAKLLQSSAVSMEHWKTKSSCLDLSNPVGHNHHLTWFSKCGAHSS